MPAKLPSLKVIINRIAKNRAPAPFPVINAPFYCHVPHHSELHGLVKFVVQLLKGMAQLNAYIGFNGDCRRAMEFYRACIGGQLTIQTMAGAAANGQCPPSRKNVIVHSALIKGELVIMGTDMIGPDGYIRGNNVALCINCTSENEIDVFYERLTAGGKVLQPLGRSLWGDTFACFTDKFGITWMLNYHEEQ